ncbi:poly-gamma-glutamate capsule biosynthesis protein CapA/YwtB (metallophosphatase superfamily) [Microbacterium phyllosphaerae]|uniref:Poly-gamma-glutamate capsule biosynthesis protein CapA/YwtB (Metallophosphatase superfamily) n=1 Tax=Microbacterium phyllosphaerae TaxID=124798 RepID=A0ABS4WSK7_9MICO|nr:CapA family protein [Microbacterium phyllosphaerae]MBP2379128.1 poly-gamma-glutamate capsule biosynthesis protein CapA/YwtB (metallophosphatase superfamily) [Microbacterium phyllosphaerae]
MDGERTMTPPQRTRRRRAGRNLRRDRRWIGASLVVAVGSAALLGSQLAFATPEPPPVVAASAPALSDGVLDLGFAGDTMFGDGSAEKLAASGPMPLLAGVAPILDDFDYTIVNAEVPFTTIQTPANPGAKYTYASDPSDLAALREIGVDALNLGNNHAMDRGGEGLADTIRYAESDGLAAFGAGATRADASMPLVVRSAQLDVAVVSFGEDFGALHRSTDTTPGMLPLRLDRVEQAMRSARDNGADKVVAFVHWGNNYEDVNAQQRYWAGVFSDAGYDAVIGSGSHTLQEVEVLDGMPVVYGMGNFVFGAPGRFAAYGKPGLGAVVGLRWNHGGTGTVSVRVIATDNKIVDYVARPVPESDLSTARAIIGDAVTWHGDVATLRF